MKNLPTKTNYKEQCKESFNKINYYVSSCFI